MGLTPGPAMRPSTNFRGCTGGSNVPLAVRPISNGCKHAGVRGRAPALLAEGVWL